MKFKRFLAAVLILALTVAFLNIPSYAAVTLSVNMGTAAYSGSRLYFSNLTVTGDGIKTILISFSGDVTSGDKIVLPASPAGFTVSSSSLTNDYAKRINVSGVTSADIQNYLRAVGYELGGESQSVQIVVTSDDIQRDTYYNSDTEHYYQFVPYSSGTTGTWTAAYTSAKSMTYMGRTGYLATVMSKAEDQFLYELSDGATGWLGGTFMSPGTKSGDYYLSFSTSSNVNYWYWACGPEIGTKFYTVQVKSSTSINDSINAGYYFNWGAVEPNSANVEQCLTTLVVSTTTGYDHNETGYQGTDFSWNNLSYDRGYTSDGLYYAKGYFVEYGDALLGDSGAGSTAFAIGSGTLSDKPVLSSGTVTRVSDMHATVKFTSDEAGTYYYVIVNDNASVPAIDTSGTGTSCIAGQNTITNPTGLTSGAKDIYIVVKDAAGMVSDPLKIDIPAFVAGVVDLTTVTWKSASTYTCGIDLPSVARMVTISVNNGSFTVPSLGSGTLVFLGGTNGSSYINSFSSSQSFNSAVFSFTDIAAAETLLGAIVYTTAGETPQTITASASSVSPQGSDIYFEGHFYRYVAGTIDWIGGVLAAGGTTDPYFGGRGYIATATNQAENSILLKLTDMGGTTGDHWYDAWMGGLWQRNTGTVASPSITRGIDGNEISYSDLLSATAAQRQSILLDYTIKYGTSVSFIYNTPDTVKYYWLDGPEAGQEIALNTTEFSPWHDGEPNNGDFNYIGWEGAYWDDLSAYSGDNSANGYAKLNGYIVEFSGYDGGSTDSVVQKDTITVTADLTGPVLTAGAVNRTSDTEGTVKFSSNEAGQYYYAIVPSGSSAPVINTTGAGISCVSGENTITNPTGLTAGAKDIYIKAKDAMGNFSNVLKIAIANFNTAPVFTNSTPSLSVDVNSAANNIKTLLAVNDTDPNQTLTWTQKTAPSHGTLSFSGATATSGGISVQPGGTVTYTPTNNYAGTDSFTVQVSDGHATADCTVSVTVTDRIAPTATITQGTNQWNSFLNTITFGLFFKQKVTISISSGDQGGSGVKTVEYYQSATQLTEQQVLALTGWSSYTSAFDIPAVDAEQFIIYAKVTDNAGNVTAVSSNGMEFDLQAPSISTDYAKDATSMEVTVTDSGSGVGTVTYTVNSGSAQTATLSGGKFTISPLSDGKYDVVITAKDALENQDSLTVHVVSLHTVTFKLYAGDTGEPLKTETVEYGNAAAAPADPTRTGFVFKSWDKTFGTITSDLTVNATWDIGGVTVVPYSGTYDGSAHDAVTVTGTLSGDTITYSANGTDYSATLPQITNAGSYPVYVKVSRTGYTPWTSTLNTAVIDRAAGIIDITSDPGKTYDGTPVSDPTVSKTGTGAVTFTYYNDNSGALGTQLSGAPTNAGTYWVKAELAQDTNYTAAQTTRKFTIDRAAGSVSITSDPGKTYNGTPVSDPTVSKNSTGAVTLTYYTDNENALGTLLSGAPTNAGTYWVKASLAQDTNYTAAQDTRQFIIERAAGSVTITSDIGKTYNGIAVTIPKVDKNSTGAVTFTYYTDNENALGTLLSGAPTDAGIYWVKAELAQDTNYTAAQDTCQFTIERAAGSVSITSDPGKVYDSTPVFDPSTTKNSTGAVTFTYYTDNTPTTDRLFVARKSVESSLGTLLPGAPTDAGTYWVKASLAQDTNYTAAEATLKFTIERAQILGSVTIPASVLTGDTVTADVTTLLPIGVTFGYQWNLDGQPITGAVSASYQVKDADYGKTLSVTVTATGNYIGSITSSGVVIGENVCPTVEIEQGLNRWNSFAPNAFFTLFFKEMVSVSVSASDAGGSGIKSVEYYRSPVRLTEQQVKALTGWVNYTAPFMVTPQEEQQFIVYARVIDNAGNVTIVNSDGMVFDAQGPSISTNYTKDATDMEVTVVDFGSGVESVFYTVNGDAAQTGSAPVFKIALADGNYDVVITAKDLLGNVSSLTVHVTSVLKVTFKSDSANGAVLLTETVEYGGTASAPAVPVREGYTFKGWDRSLDKITGDVVICAIWEVAVPQSGTIGDSGNSGSSSNSGSDVTAPGMGNPFNLYPLLLLAVGSLAIAVIIRNKENENPEDK